MDDWYFEDDQMRKIRYQDVITPEILRKVIGYDLSHSKNESEFFCKKALDSNQAIQEGYAAGKVGLVPFNADMKASLEGYNTGTWSFEAKTRAVLNIKHASMSNNGMCFLYGVSYEIFESSLDDGKITVYK